jgi:hypothetical protein
MLFTLARVGQYFIRGVNELEGLGSLRVPTVPVRMKLLAQRLVGRPNHLGGRVARHLQIIVMSVRTVHEPLENQNKRRLIENHKTPLRHLNKLLLVQISSELVPTEQSLLYCMTFA